MRFLARVIFTIGLSLVAFSGKLYLWPMGDDAAAGEALKLGERTSKMAEQIRAFTDSRKPPRAFLPEPPEGWSRRAFVWDDLTRMPGFAGLEEEMLGYGQFYGTKAIGLHAKGPEKTFTKQKSRTTWMYEKGDALVELTAIRPKPVQGLKVQKDAMKMVGANMQAFQMEEPFGVIRGVVWKKVLASVAATGAGKIDWTLAAEFGDLHLFARGQGATEAEMRGLIAAIDYDGLNRGLDTPLPGVGSAAPELTAAQEMSFARAEMARQGRDRVEAARQAKQQVQQTLKAVTGADETPVPEVKVNRFGGKANRKTGCGGTSFCTVSD